MKILYTISAILILAAAAFPVTLDVPSLKYPTIQSAINAAAKGDLVLVAPGTYFENIDFSGKTITVKSSDGSYCTFIDGSQAGSVVVFRNHESSKSVLDGFTISNGTGTQHPDYGGWVGGGIFCYKASPTIINN
ncbi:MAG: right-handed parallel beta-helix repeat-containing protein, partial [Planctomycetota bacterium]